MVYGIGEFMFEERLLEDSVHQGAVLLMRIGPS